MFTVENVIRSATRKFSDDPLNILVVCSNNEKYLSLLSKTGHNFFVITKNGSQWKGQIEKMPENFCTIDQNWPSSYFDMVLCNERVEQYGLAEDFSTNFHLPILLIDHVSSHAIRPHNAFAEIHVEFPQSLIKNCSASGSVSEYVKSSWPGSNLSLTIPIGIDTEKFSIPPVRILDEAFGNELSPTRIVFDNNTQPEIGDAIFSSFVENSHTVIPTDSDIVEKERIYQQGDYFLNAQNHVTVKMLEAMACGNIPICFKRPDTEQFIDHGVDGFLIDEPQEVPSLIEKLDGLSPEQRAQISHQAREKILTTVSTPEDFASKWNGIFSYMRSQYYTIQGTN